MAHQMVRHPRKPLDTTTRDIRLKQLQTVCDFRLRERTIDPS